MKRKVLSGCFMLLASAGFAGKVLFKDDFSNSAGQWISGDKGRIVKDGFLIKGDGKTTKVIWTKKGADWTDYVVEFDVTIKNRQAGWLIRKSKNGYYMFLLRGPYLNRLVYNKKLFPCGKTPLSPPVPSDKKVHVKIEVLGNTIKHYIDGKLVDTLVDGTHNAGAFGFRQCGSESGLFANVAISEPDMKPAGAQSVGEGAVATAPFSTKKPVIDGKFESGEWSQAAVLGGFSDLTGKTSVKPTTVYVQWDKSNLYLAFRSQKRFVRTVPRLKRDDDTIFRDDAIEINLAPKPGQWFKLAFNPAGSKWDKLFNGRVMDKTRIWNPDWKVVNNLIHDDYYVQDEWLAEVAVPFSALGVAAPEPGQSWRVQLCRDYDNVKELGYPLPMRWTCWDPRGNFQDPQFFGKLTFVRDKPVFRLNRLAKFDKGVLGVSGEVIDKGNAAIAVKLAGGIADDPDNQFLNRVFKTGSDVAVTAPAKINETSVVDYSWRVVADKQVIAAGRARGVCSPPFSVILAPLFTQNKMWADGDFSKLLDLPASRQVVITITNDAGTEQITASQDVSGVDKFFIPLDIAKLRPGKFLVKVELQDKAGKVLAATGKRLTRPVNPAWNQGVELGKLTAPPSGWTALKTTRSGSQIILSSFAKQYFYDNSALPQKITIRKRPFLAAPARLIVNAKPVRITEFKLLSSSDLEAQIAWHGQSADGGLILSGKAMIGFDGLIWNDLIVKSVSGAGAKLDNLEISLQLTRKNLRYLRSRNNMNFLGSIGMRYLAFIGDAKISDATFPQPADRGNLSVNGWKWPEKFCNFYWVGGVDFGMFTMFKSPRNMQTTQYSKVEEAPDRITLTFPLVSSPVKLDVAGRRFEFGFIGTPVRSIGNRDRLQRVGFNHFYKYDPAHFRKALSRVWGSGPLSSKFFTGPRIDVNPGDVASRVIQCGLTCSLGNPYLNPKQEKQLTAQVKASKQLKISPLLWCDLTYTGITMQNEFPYRYEWEQYPEQRHIGTAAAYSLVCPQQAWHNFYIYGITQRLANNKVKGFYLDMTGYGSCNNKYHGCGYVENRQRLGEVPILELRNLFLKFWNVTHKFAPENIILQHGQTLTPCALWTDVITQGENWANVRNKGRFGYQSLSLPYYQIAYMPQRQYGTQFNWFQTLNTPSYVPELKNIIPLDEVVGLALLHDNLPIGQTSQQVPGLVTCWNAMSRFGAYKPDTVWSPYWENQLGDWKHGIAVSYYRRGENFLVIAFNSSYDKTLKVALPEQIFGKGTAYNVINGQNEPYNILKIAPRKTKFLIINRRNGK